MIAFASLSIMSGAMSAFSKKLANHEAAIALHFMYYNFGRIHQTLRITPAMAAGVSDHVWSLEEIVKLKDTPHRDPVIFM